MIFKFQPLITAGIMSAAALASIPTHAQSTDDTSDVADTAVSAAGNRASEAVPSSGSTVKGPKLSLYHGEVQVLDIANVSRIAVGNGEVLKANVVSASQVVLIGESAGTTSLRVWSRSGTQFTYEVTVHTFDTSQILRDVQDLLASEPGISARQVDGHVLIEGDYSAAKTATRIEALMKIYPQIVSTVPVRKEAPGVAIDRMVYMDVRVVEINKSTLRRLGVNWNPQAQGPQVALNASGVHNIPHIPLGTGIGIATNLASMLDVTEQAGESWTLAEPTVSCKSGGSAKFTVGGEIPVPVAAGLGTSTVIYKEYGVILEFKPIADGNGNISSSIVAEVSQPDQSFANLNNNGFDCFLEDPHRNRGEFEGERDTGDFGPAQEQRVALCQRHPGCQGHSGARQLVQVEELPERPYGISGRGDASFDRGGRRHQQGTRSASGPTASESSADHQCHQQQAGGVSTHVDHRTATIERPAGTELWGRSGEDWS